MPKYTSKLGLIETEKAIKYIKDTFEARLAEALGLTRVSAPLFVPTTSGLNDDLNGVERSVSFDILETGEVAEVVHSLAKWKRHALGQYGFEAGTGLYTDMNAIRRDEVCDALHSLYVDQWDWELVLTPEQRTIPMLKSIVQKIYAVIREVAAGVQKRYPAIHVALPEEITFLTTQELEDRWPALTSQQRENEAAKAYGAVFLIGIGGALKSGDRHDGRAPDYDDWALNGDILIWYPLLGRAMELSSMGIRVDKESLARQLKIAGKEDRLTLPFHKALMEDRLPLTAGGGIGQSRLCMFMLEKAHIGEVQASLWPQPMIAACEAEGIFLL
ncbi:MAG: aspartate--ammonia ligase [Ruminococcaceae bacterium]|nr:aspartate--ammonia ligase [Oscillospiraceae bacterium]